MSDTALAVDGELELSAAQLADIQSAMDENTDFKAEVQMHRLALLQPLSPEVAGSQSGYQPGMFVDNVSREILSSFEKPRWLIEKGVPEGEVSPCHVLLVAPIFKLPTEFIHWIPRNDRKEGEPPFRWKSLDASDPRVREGVWPQRGGTWGTTEATKGKAPPVTDNINHLILPLDHMKKVQKAASIIATFSRTSAAAGKMFTTYVNNHKLLGMPPWGQTYWLYSKKEFNQKANATYYSMQVAPGPRLQVAAPGTIALIASMAMFLADKAEGKSRQEAMLNVSLVEDDASGHTEGSADSNTVDGTASNPVTGGEDPFAG